MLSLPRRFVARTLVAAFALTLLLFPVAGAQSAPAAETPSSLGIIRICTNCTSYGLNRAGSYRYVLLHGWQSNLIPRLKAANPNLKVLAYKNMAASYAYACTDGVDNLYPAGVGYCDASAHHPEWFLADTTGARIEFCDYKGLWQMDVGNPEYQAAWEANVAADLRARGFDGVEVDDTNWNEQYHLCGRTIAKYPNNGDYGAATRSFLARVGPALKSKGFLVLPNIALPYSSSNYETWSDWISFTSGAIQEHFSKWGSGTTQQFGDADWKWRQGFLPLTQKAGKIFLGITYAPMSDVRSMAYARANFLLDWDGGPSALIFEPSNPEQQDPHAAAWTQDIGSPLKTKFQVGAAWRRNYSGGIVLVNSSATVTQSVALGGAFVAADGSTITSVTLPPLTGAILKATAAPSSPAAGPPPSIASDAAVARAIEARQSPARVVAWGAIRVHGGKRAWFGIRLGVRGRSTTVAYVDRRSGMRFRATRINRVTKVGHTLRMHGRGVSRGRRPVAFTLVLRDGGRRSGDRLGIVVGKGYVAQGLLAAGSVVIG
jgi:hypothetical protein